MPNYSRWDLVKEFTDEQAAALWCGIEPGTDGVLTRVNHPEIVAIDQLLDNARNSDQLPWRLGLPRPSEVGMFALTQRSDLEAFATAIGVKPKFLFPNARTRVEAISDSQSDGPIEPTEAPQVKIDRDIQAQNIDERRWEEAVQLAKNISFIKSGDRPNISAISLHLAKKELGTVKRTAAVDSRSSTIRRGLGRLNRKRGLL